jgi:hypothetical protein
MLRGAQSARTRHAEDQGLARGGLGDTDQVAVPDLVEMIRYGSQAEGHEAGLVVVLADPTDHLSAGSRGRAAGR